MTKELAASKETAKREIRDGQRVDGSYSGNWKRSKSMAADAYISREAWQDEYWAAR
jgi:hypothetical protein